MAATVSSSSVTDLARAAKAAARRLAQVDSATKNRALLAKRDRLQTSIDAWHRERRGGPIDADDHRAFLREIGYLVAEPAPFTITTRGVDAETAERVYEMVVGFSGFGFPKAHGAAFGLLAYQSTWLHVHYAPEFLCALLNEQPMGFYAPDTLAHEAQRKGIELVAPDEPAATDRAAVLTDAGVLGAGMVQDVCAAAERTHQDELLRLLG